MGIEIKVYGKKECALCAATKNKISHLLKVEKLEKEVELNFVDVGTVNGLAESAEMGIIDIPTTVIINSKEEVVYTLSKTVPNSDYIKEKISEHLYKPQNEAI